MSIHIAVIEGSTRNARKSIHAARLVAEVGRTLPDIEITFVDPIDYPIPDEGNDEGGKNKEWEELQKKLDAYFIVTPEYNHAFPGSLKMLLDDDLGNYTHKPVSFAGVSSGMIGGARAIMALLGVVRELGMVATYADLFFPKVQKLFDENGEMLPKYKEKYVERIKKSYAELIWMAKTLKWGRENL